MNYAVFKKRPQNQPRAREHNSWRINFFIRIKELARNVEEHARDNTTRYLRKLKSNVYIYIYIYIYICTIIKFQPGNRARYFTFELVLCALRVLQSYYMYARVSTVWQSGIKMKTDDMSRAEIQFLANKSNSSTHFSTFVHTGHPSSLTADGYARGLGRTTPW